MTPVQFVKSTRLEKVAVKIAGAKRTLARLRRTSVPYALLSGAGRVVMIALRRAWLVFAAN